MADFNDYAYFAGVVRYGGFAPAGRAMRTPSSADGSRRSRRGSASV